MKPITLEAMARRLSRLADDTFEKFGELPDMLWLVDATDELGMHMMVLPTTERRMELMPAGLRDYFAEHGVTRYARASEVWYSEHPIEHRTEILRQGLVTRPSRDPRRKEAVAIFAEDKTKELCGMREIIRPPNGKPYLGKLELVDNSINAGLGRFANLLPGQAEVTSH
jgi:hypothetical protein